MHITGLDIKLEMPSEGLSPAGDDPELNHGDNEISGTVYFCSLYIYSGLSLAVV